MPTTTWQRRRQRQREHTHRRRPRPPLRFFDFTPRSRLVARSVAPPAALHSHCTRYIYTCIYKTSCTGSAIRTGTMIAETFGVKTLRSGYCKPCGTSVASVIFSEYSRFYRTAARGSSGGERGESMQWWVSLVKLAKKCYNSQTIKSN
jgi:hypothetical protein